MLNNYDKIASQYDLLSRLVFFKSQVNAQINQLEHIPAGSVILIVGGGTGWILEKLDKIYTDLQIVYVEISAKMLKLSEARKYENNSVEFVNMGIENFKTNQTFDVVLTPFLFDNFKEELAENVFTKLNLLLKPNGLWFLVDFSLNKKGKFWKLVLLKLMYSFFKLINIVETTKLINMEPYFLKANYLIVKEQFYYGDFIIAAIYKKHSP